MGRANLYAFESNGIGRRLLGGLCALASVAAVGCTSRPPAQLDDVCGIFDEKRGLFVNWHDDAQAASKKYQVPVPVLMATIHQESRFRPKARPPRPRLLGFIPWKRRSSAYGYAQAVDETWDWYATKSGNRGATRDRFDDAVDFVAWYHDATRKRTGVAADDPYHLYLAYHEGHGGFERRTYLEKAWLQQVAQKVDRRTRLYARQYQGCRGRLERRGWW